MNRPSKRRRREDGVSRWKIPRRRSLAWSTSLLVELGDELQRARQLEAILQAVTRTSVRLTRSVQGTLRLLDESGKRLLTSARTGPSVHRRGATAFRLGEGFIGWVVVHRQPAFTNHPASDPRFVARASQVWTPSALLAVPLVSGRNCIGVLSVSQKTKKPYRKLDLDLLHLVADLSVPHLEIARLKRLNESDPLTLLHNRRHVQDRLPVEMQRSRRSGRPLVVAMIDIDRFKRVNDNHGHDVGDEVLCEVADRLRRVSRSSDVVCRWGGEEFLGIFPETNMRQGRLVAERIRRSVADTPFLTSAGPLHLTVSVGICRLSLADDDRSLVRRADQALYSAKRRGRNRVTAAKSRGKKAQ
jgi:diguanylate cyclase (GGDEF)-like protein